MNPENIAKAYEPQEVESRWYRHWEENGLFQPEFRPDRPHYSVVIPPPNVTGNLHMGHALNNTLQDILVRYHRMKGDNTLWVPGTDHAGIATQNVVERQLASEGLSREDLGREAFIERVWTWRRQYGGQIINQLKRLGASCDWSRERFTMDEGLSRAVRRVFIQLYEEGLIYRGDRIINWCPRCMTALADLEVEHEDLDAHLYYVRYPLADGSGHLTVATTRPETMLGDTAVAVHPEDPRYMDFIGKEVILPVLERRIPVIADPYVDREFGTGSLKITPAHDPNDFEIGLRHNLPAIKCIGDDGLMNEEAGPFAGMDRFECRKQILDRLEKDGLLDRVEPLRHAVGHCYRCKTVVEPNLSKQWFVSAKPLAEKAIKAVETGRTRITPQTWEKTYYDWMYNIKDWCVSRQLWWGHRIPAYYCQACGEVVVAEEAPASCPKCGGAEFIQETDVLDTWFSSGLWPFSTLGWPDETQDLKTFYPTSVLVTAFDILFFWVARMMMMGIHFMGEVPFDDVYIHAIVRDADGQKMSKSKGNVIDPLVVMDKFGTDAFRFTLTALAAQGRDVKLSDERIEGYQRFVNKLWNASRFTLMNLADFEADADPRIAAYLEKGLTPEVLASFDRPTTLADAWILSRLATVVREAEANINGFHFDHLANDLYHFFWHEFCDWHLELAKQVMYGEDPDARRKTQAVLHYTLSVALRLMHPIMPFVTEEIWQMLPGCRGSIMKAPFPTPPEEYADPRAEEQMGLVQDVITAVRNIRGEMNVPPSHQVTVVAGTHDAETRRVLEEQAHYVTSQARAASFTVNTTGEKPKGAAAAVARGVEVFVVLAGLINIDEEEARLKKELTKVEQEIIHSNKKLSNEDFLAKAPAAVVGKVKDRLAELRVKHEKLSANISRLEELR